MEAGVPHSNPAVGHVPDMISYGNAVDEDVSRRNRETNLRREINRLLARPDSSRRTLQACTDAVVHSLNVIFARIWTLQRNQETLKLRASSGLYTGLNGKYSRIPIGQMKIGRIAQTRIPCLSNAALGDLRMDQEWVTQEGIVAFAGYPLVVDDRAIGVIAVFARHPIRSETLETIGSIAGIVAQGIERQRSQRELRRAIKAGYDAVAEERTRIAREMHDGLLQNVTGIALQLRAVLPRVRSAPEEAGPALERILELAERTNTEARLAVVGIRHFTDSDDVVKALHGAVERALEGSTLDFSVNVRGRTRPMCPQVCDAATLIVQHAITNVLRHAQAQRVQLALDFGTRSLRISIRDDGRGFVPDDVKTSSNHFGLLGMGERAREIGARLRVRSTPERGTTVSVVVPFGTGSPPNGEAPHSLKR
ncbi:MAG: histidine kinase [Gemmatimonadaceae bacterium]